MKINLVSLKNNFNGKLIIEPGIEKKCNVGEKFIRKWNKLLPENSSIEISKDGNMNLEDSICHINSYVDGKPIHGILYDDCIDFSEKTSSANHEVLEIHLLQHLREINEFIIKQLDQTKRSKQDKKIAVCIECNMDQGVY